MLYFFESSSGLPGEKGCNGIKGDTGYSGPPGIKVRINLKHKTYLIVFCFYKGDQGMKGEAGYIQKYDFNSTHILLMGAPGLPGLRVGFKRKSPMNVYDVCL